jgi:urease accessory protein
MSIPVQLWLMLDSRSPAGAHSHSGGMEAAVTSGYIDTVEDVRDFCRGRLHTTGRVVASFASTACRAWQQGWEPSAWSSLDAEFGARTPSAATRTASRKLGSGLYRLLRATVPDQVGALNQQWQGCAHPAPHHPLVLGAATALSGGDARIAGRLAALGICTGPASAAVRLLGLDPFAVHAMTAALADEIEQVADSAAGVVVDPEGLAALPRDSAPALELLADVHAQMEVRLFAS